jgi:hypothetical protein
MASEVTKKISEAAVLGSDKVTVTVTVTGKDGSVHGRQGRGQFQRPERLEWFDPCDRHRDDPRRTSGSAI